jgi:AcrR family transcriptional regulator
MTTELKPRTRRSTEGSGRSQDPDGTRQNIIEVATREFADKGLAGARIDEIAAKTKASKRMIYYYFGDKEGLYVSVLEAAYSTVRAEEATLRLDDLPPLEALEKLVQFTFDHHNRNEAFIRLVMIENIHNAEYLGRSRVIEQLNVAAIGTIRRIYERGLAEGLFRPGIDPTDLHWQISALCFFNVSNRATFSRIFQRDLGSKENLARLRAEAVEMIVRFVRSP